MRWLSTTVKVVWLLSVVVAAFVIVARYARTPTYHHLAPAAPESVVATPGNRSVTVSWTAPSYSRVSSYSTTYLVTASSGTGSCTTVGRSCTVTGLRNGTAYEFTVVAHDTGGTSAGVTSAPVQPTKTTHPLLVVRPASALAGGQTVSVSGSGFTPDDHVVLIECRAGATGRSGCATSTATTAVITSRGTLPATPFRVVTGTVGASLCGTVPANLAACVVAVGNATGGDATQAHIAFK